MRVEDLLRPSDDPNAAEAAARSLQQFASGNGADLSRDSTISDVGEEAVVYTQARMLQDPTGRLLYVGDAGTLSFLQLLRMMVENVIGPSTFTNDPRRHKITESQFSLPLSGNKHTQLLPDKRTAHVLIESFFTNTHGFLQIFDKVTFLNAIEACYLDPLSAEPSWICLLNLVFAIGLILACPLANTQDATIIERLRRESWDRSEIFYFNAKSYHDPMTGIEDADFWSIQALLLMSVYMLCKSKRNSSFALLGMAVRSAYALGLHREETMIIFNQEEQAARRNLWRSLFVIDRFLSASLGRPTAISEDDCSGDTLRPMRDDAGPFGFGDAFSTNQGFDESTSVALDAAVRSSTVIGQILKKVYQQRKISTRLAEQIADICKTWPKQLAPTLHWRQAAKANSCQGIAILHVNLLYCHSIILLTRPFFLYILNAETQKDAVRSSNGQRNGRNYVRMEKFSEACVIASTHTIVLVDNAFQAGYLPRRNPFMIYFLFAAGLVLLANEFALLYTNAAADQCIRNAMTVIAYCSETEPQAPRLLYILNCFRDVVMQQRERRKQFPQMTTGAAQRVSTVYDTQQQQQQQDIALPSMPDMSSFQTDPEPVATTQFQPPSPVQTYSVQDSHILRDPPATQEPTYGSLPHAYHSHAVQGAPIGIPRTPETSRDDRTPRDPPPLESEPTLSNLLDFSALETVKVPSLHSDDMCVDDHIDFDALWAWPSNTPAMGSPQIGGELQGISDSAVPLFGVVSDSAL